jgi:hypothetical protein
VPHHRDGLIVARGGPLRERAIRFALWHGFSRAIKSRSKAATALPKAGSEGIAETTKSLPCFCRCCCLFLLSSKRAKSNTYTPSRSKTPENSRVKPLNPLKNQQPPQNESLKPKNKPRAKGNLVTLTLVK